MIENISMIQETSMTSILKKSQIELTKILKIKPCISLFYCSYNKLL